MVLLIINGVVGSGIFGLPAKTFRETGVYSIAAFGVCAIAVFIIILCFAEVSSRFDKTGGPYPYALSSFGPLPAFLTGWLLLVTRLITYAALINLLVTYLSVFSDWFTLPSARIISIISLTMFLAVINHIGVKDSTRVNNILTVAKLLPLLLFIIVGSFFIEPANFEIKLVPDFSSFSSTVLLLVFAFGGFESVLVNSGEVKDPGKNLPFALRFFTGDWSDLQKVKLHLKGTAFQLKVWQSLLKIPFGNISTYASIAANVKSPGASRAVGSAIGSNPVAFLIPCHRVIRSSGIFGEYHWGSERKTAILGWEAAKCSPEN